MTATDSTYDVVVLGAGPAGEHLAGALRDRDLSVAIVESRLVGGECAFYACMPSKALLRPAEALAETERVPGAAEAVRGPLDVGRLLARRDEVVHHLDDAPNLDWLAQRVNHAVPRARTDRRRAARRRRRPAAARHAGRSRSPSDSAPALPPIPGLDARQAVDQPRGDSAPRACRRR